jgi:MFS family permease
METRRKTKLTCLILLGFGCMSGSFATGYLMDRDHRRTEVEYCKARGYPLETRINSKSHEDFPIEKARLRNNWWIVLIFVATVIAYGFSLDTHLAVPIILQYLIAFGATSVFSVNSALVIDLYPGKSASATAVNNLMRCSVGAAGVAVAQPMIDGLTAKYSFLLLGGVSLIFSPLLVIEYIYGMKWRLARAEKRRKVGKAPL